MKNSLLIVITGISGSGKSTAMRVFEDEGFFCIDNIPIDILIKVVDMYDIDSIKSTRLCIGLDMRSGFQNFVDKAPGIFELFKKSIPNFRLIFLETATDKLLNRFKETRRRHPLSDMQPNILDAINTEKEMMSPLKAISDYVIDTTGLNIHELSARMKQIIDGIGKSRDMYIEVRSFGFKKGIPVDADIVLDVRFLPNPYFVEHLREQTGESEEIKQYLESFEEYREFIKKASDLVSFILPLYKKEGRSYLNIAIGCTGGRHRSVAVARDMENIIGNAGYNCKLIHRDI